MAFDCEGAPMDLKSTQACSAAPNFFRAKWSIRPLLISGFRTVKRVRVCVSPEQDTYPSQVSPQQMRVCVSP